MKRYSIPIAVVLCVFFLVGCAQFQKIKNPADMSPKEKAAWMLSMYRKQYDDYLDTIIDPALPASERDALKVAVRDGQGLPDDKRNPNLTDAQKEVLNKQRDILIELEPLIEGYGEWVQSGAVPDAATEKRILDLINDLVYG